MPINKAHEEFHRVDMNTGWEVPTGYPAGIEQKFYLIIHDRHPVPS